VSAMDSEQHCRDQAAECIRLIKSAKSLAEAEVLRNISSSWSRLAGQIDRYAALVRDRGRITPGGAKPSNHEPSVSKETASARRGAVPVLALFPRSEESQFLTSKLLLNR
jgi:hypothetical protein